MLRTAGGAAVIGGAALLYFRSKTGTRESVVDYTLPVPTRAEQVVRLSEGTASNPFDVLVIGGGATGTGCALDAATRGLRTALVEGEDFGSGTSSRSTKLVHGGVRYLEKAVFQLDYSQLSLVFDALNERKTLLSNAPHLTSSLPIMTPCYKWWEVPYYWAGLKAYDLVAGTHGLTMSRFVTPRESRRQFPTLSPTRSDGSSLQGTILYYDGQFNDSRLNVTLACTAALAGAVVLNYTKCSGFIKNDGQVVGVTVEDNMTGRKKNVYAKTIVNATGPFTDGVRKLCDPDAETMIMPSAGVHITLPDYYSPDNIGMIVPKTKDGRVVFMLPWLDHTIAGTTDSSSEITMLPKPSEQDVQFILDAIADYLTVQVRPSDVQSAWSGIRPLAIDPNASDTASASRDHVVTMDEESKIVTVSGGKWTTYRRMAEDAINLAVSVGDLHPLRQSCTNKTPLLGAPAYTLTTFTEVAQNYVVPHRPGAIDTRVAKHLAHAYGDRCGVITKIAEDRQLGKRIVRGHPIIEAEVIYSVQNEYCQTIVDFIARRTRLAFLDARAAGEAIPRVAELMAGELRWGRYKKTREIRRAQTFLKTFEAPPCKFQFKKGDGK